MSELAKKIDALLEAIADLVNDHDRGAASDAAAAIRKRAGESSDLDEFLSWFDEA